MDAYLNVMWTIFKIACFVCLAFLLLGIVAFFIRRARGEKVAFGLGQSLKERLPSRKKVERTDDDFEDFLND